MNIDSIFVFESPFVTSLYPFSILHCGWELRTGYFRLFEKYQQFFPDKRIIFQGRDKHLKSFLARFGVANQEVIKENIFVINSAVVPSTALFEEIKRNYQLFLQEKSQSKSALFVHQGTPLAAYLVSDEMINPGEFDKLFLPKLFTEFNRLLPNIEIDKPDIINFLWDTFDIIGKNIADDFELVTNSIDFKELKSHGVALIHNDNIKIGQGSKLMPGVVIDGSKGHVIIGSNVQIMPNSVIFGPCSIGDNTVVKAGARIYGNTAIGEWCKVGGEIENSVIHAYSNKQHDGFLGHSYLGEWVNIGADSNTSDLKNTYSDITINFHKQQINTGRIFLGLLCGDHTKTAINTSFTTGTVAGICGIVVADGFLPNYIPSFAWRGTKGCAQYKIEKAIETAEIVMNRRNKNLLDEEKVLMELEFEQAKSLL